ncbi:MAG TPA: DUF4270 family protein [Lacibacter sp.]|nr:DUF4270 family protein [Lacibacter sp.]
MSFLTPEMRTRITFLFVPVFILLLISSCTKLERTTLGGDLLPGTDRLTTDTIILPVVTTNYLEVDSSYIAKADQHLLGFVNDPMFGTTTASMYLQLLPTLYPFTYAVAKDSLFLDSCVLSLSFAGAYGDTSAVSKVNVYKITDPTFKSNRVYRITEAPDFSTGDFLGTASFTVGDIRRPYRAAYKADSVINQLRIRLSDAFGRLLLDQDNINGAFKNDTTFKNFLNGLAIVTDSVTSGNVINYFQLTGETTRLNLYYRQRNREGKDDTTVARFTFVNDTIRSANANKIHRNYAGSTAQPVINAGTPSSLVYVQAAPGTAVRVSIPGLDTLSNRPYIIHRAELVAQQVYQGPLSIENMFVPPFLHMSSFSTTGAVEPIPFDQQYYMALATSNGASYLNLQSDTMYTLDFDYTGGGTNFVRDAANNLIAEYRLNMTSYLQNLVNNKATKRDFKLSAPYIVHFTAKKASASYLNPLAYGRVQLGGGSHPTQKMYVRIYYSKQ